jgi:hypothetical protein
MSTDSNSDVSKQSGIESRPPNGLRILKLAAIAVGIVAVGASVTGGVWYLNSREPALHPVRGVVFLDGEPMAGGAVISFYGESSDWSGALAGINEDGTFEFTTNGAKGAYEGTHGVTFTLMKPGMPPISLLPGKYVDPNNPPYTIEVGPGMEPLKFELSGRLNEKPVTERAATDNEATESTTQSDSKQSDFKETTPE